MIKFEKKITDILKVILVLFSGCVAFASLIAPSLVPEVIPESYLSVDYKWMVLFAIIYCLVLCGVFYLCKMMPELKLKYLMYAMIMFAFWVQIVIVIHMKVIPKVDLKHIYNQVIDMLELNTMKFTNEKYFSFYTNNIPIGIVVYWIFRIAETIGFTDYRLVGGIFNVFMILIIYIFAYKLLRRMTNERVSFIVMFVVLTNPIFYAYASYYYTDTISLGIMLPSVYFMFVALKENYSIKKCGLYIVAGILIGLAAQIRVTSIFIVLAIVVFLVLKQQWKELIKSGSSLLLGLLVFSAIWNGIYDYHIDFDTTEKAVPIQHFLMMGSKEKGTYDDDDVKFTRSFKTHDEKVENTTKVWLERIKENGIIGNIQLVAIKEIVVWCIGTRGYLQYTQFVEAENICYHFISGQRSIYFRSFMQAYNVVLFLLIGLGIWSDKKEKRDEMLILSIYWAGAIVFYMFWEAHMRHATSFLVLLTMMIIPLMERVGLNKDVS